MGYDTLSIVSMNSAREGINSLDRSARGSYLNQLLNGIKPDIGILPWDHLGRDTLLKDYGQFLSPDQKGTLMLYDINKVAMKSQMNVTVRGTVFNDLCLNPDIISWPEVTVSSLEPVKQIVKTFSLITFNYEMFTSTNTKSNERLMKDLAILAQRIALLTGNPILIAGEIRLSQDTVRAVLSEENAKTEQSFVQDQNSFLQQLGHYSFTPEMVRGSTRDFRHMFKLNLVECKRKESIVKTWSPQQADCFIASKGLEMSEAKGIEIKSILGQQVKLPSLKKEHVIHSEIPLPVRPPKHHGG